MMSESGELAAREQRWYWLAGGAIGFIYLMAYAIYIWHYEAFPYLDGWGYVTKTYWLADHHVHFWNVMGWLRSEAPERGVFLPMMAAEIGGSDADTRMIALIWLIARMSALVGGEWMLAQATKRPAIVPVIFLVVLGTPIYMTFGDPYLMDLSFGCFGMLMFGALMWDDVERRGWSSWLVGVSSVLMFLVKPVAPVLLLPLLVFRGVREVMRWRRREWPGPRRVLAWGSGYIFLGVVMVLLMCSPYGDAIRWQYHVGIEGPWTLNSTWEIFLRLLVALAPLTVVVGIAWYWMAGWRSKNAWVFWYAEAMVGCWLVFNFEISYTTEERIIAAAMPILAAAIVAAAADHRKVFRTVGGLAAGLFAVNFLIASGAAGHVELGSKACLLSLEPAYQAPVGETGLKRLAMEINGATALLEGDRVVRVLFLRPYVDAGALGLAERELSAEGKGGVRERDMLYWDLGARAFSMEAFLQTRLFLTQESGKGDLQPEYWLTMNAADRLITDPGSPLRPLIERMAIVRAAGSGFSIRDRPKDS